MTSPGQRAWLLDRSVRLLRARGYRPRTTEAYLRWTERFLVASRRRRPRQLSREDVRAFLTPLVEEEGLAPRSINQALSALALFFREILGRDELADMPRARAVADSQPVVLSHEEATLVLDQLSGRYRLLASLMYGCGLRLMEAHRLRVSHIDFDRQKIIVTHPTGAHRRRVVLPQRLTPFLRRQIDRVSAQFRSDRERGAGWAPLPPRLTKRDAEAGYSLEWQIAFPATRWSKDPATRRIGRKHLSPTATQRRVRQAARMAAIGKPVTCRTLRAAFAAQMLGAGYDLQIVQTLMGHRDPKTTRTYAQGAVDAGSVIKSPLDRDLNGSYAATTAEGD